MLKLLIYEYEVVCCSANNTRFNYHTCQFCVTGTFANNCHECTSGVESTESKDDPIKFVTTLPL